MNQIIARPWPRWVGLTGAIASAAIVGTILSGIAPLLSLNLERVQLSSSWIGLMGAIPSIAIISISALIPPLIARIGAFASIFGGSLLAFVMLLLFPLFAPVPSWFALRFIMAMGIGLALVISDTWINALAPPEKRGTIIGIFVAMLSFGMAVGPILISATGSQGALPFLVIAGIMAVSLFAIPLAHLAGAPALINHAPIPLAQAFARAPLIMLTSLVTGLVWMTITALLPVYGVRSGLAEDAALLLLTAYIVGNVALQYPIGRALDRWNASTILTICGAIQVLGAFLVPLVIDSGILAWAILAVWGGSLGGTITTSMTMLGRYFPLDQLAGANVACSLALEVGALVGPMLAGLAMMLWDPHGMLAIIGAGGAVLTIAALRAMLDARRAG